MCLMSLSDATTEMGIVTISATNPSCSRAPVAWNCTLNPFDLKMKIIFLYIKNNSNKDTQKLRDSQVGSPNRGVTNFYNALIFIPIKLASDTTKHLHYEVWVP